MSGSVRRQGTPTGRAILAIAAFVAAVALWVPAAASAAAPGGFVQLASPLGCLQASNASCGDLRNGSLPYQLVMSPDGKEVYATAWSSNAILTFDRNATTGKLTQKASTAGCISGNGAPDCAAGRFLSSPLGILLSADGKTAYVDSANAAAVLVFSRNTTTGVLTQKPDDAGCIATGNTNCQQGRAIGRPYRMAMSPDGKFLYVTSSFANSFTAIKINTDGTLGQVNDDTANSKYGCFIDSSAGSNPDLCGTRTGLNGAWGVAVSPDGKSVYVSTYTGRTLLVFDRDPANGRIAVPTTGTTCYQAPGAGLAGCTDLDGIGNSRDVTVDKAGKHVYYVSETANRLLVFDRATNGAITLHPGTTGCISGTAVSGCATARSLSSPRGLRLSAGGEQLYVASNNALTEYRVASDGGLTETPGSKGCASPSAAGCGTSTNTLSGAEGIVLSPDGKFIYLGTEFSSAINAFKRDSAAPTCGASSVTVNAGSVTALHFPCSDIDGDPFNTSIVAPPTLGSLGAIDQNAHTVIYAAPQNQNGQTTFTFRSAYPNGTFQTGLGRITVTVVGASTGGGGGGGGGGCTDEDHDGFCAGQDCNDHDPNINPSAKEIRGNNIDENCDGVALGYLDIRATVTPLWVIQGSKFTLNSLQLKGVGKGMKVTMTCKGKGCPFKSKTLKSAKDKHRSLQALKKLGKKRKFRAGNTLTVKFTQKKRNTKYAIFKLKAGKIPNGKAQCQSLGTTKRRACH